MRNRTSLQFSPGAAGPLLLDSARDLDWQDRARCAETDPEAFFPEKGGSTAAAKRICMACDVRAECLEYALANGERYGVFGGKSEPERRRILRDRRTGKAAA